MLNPNKALTGTVPEITLDYIYNAPYRLGATDIAFLASML
jgi:hypothetical protein